MKEEILLEFLGEGGSIKIVKVGNEDKNVFRLITEENTFDSHNKVSDFKTFVHAFKELDKKYQWYYLHLQSVSERYREIIRLKLVEHSQKSSFDEERYFYVRESFEGV